MLEKYYIGDNLCSSTVQETKEVFIFELFKMMASSSTVTAKTKDRGKRNATENNDEEDNLNLKHKIRILELSNQLKDKEIKIMQLENENQSLKDNRHRLDFIDEDGEECRVGARRSNKVQKLPNDYFVTTEDLLVKGVEKFFLGGGDTKCLFRFVYRMV